MFLFNVCVRQVHNRKLAMRMAYLMKRKLQKNGLHSRIWTISNLMKRRKILQLIFRDSGSIFTRMLYTVYFESWKPFLSLCRADSIRAQWKAESSRQSPIQLHLKISGDYLPVCHMSLYWAVGDTCSYNHEILCLKSYWACKGSHSHAIPSPNRNWHFSAIDKGAGIPEQLSLPAPPCKKW